MLPHNDDAERAILGSLLMNSEVYDSVSSILHASDFYHPNHQIIFESITELLNSGTTLDGLILTDYLSKKNLLDKAGGIAYIAELTDNVSVTSHVLKYAQIVREESRRRFLYKLSMKLSNDAFDETKDIESSIDQGADSLNNLLLDMSSISNDYYLKSIITDTYNKIVNKAEGTDDEEQPISTGFDLLDRYCNGGLSKEDYIIVAARPSIGKTAFGISMMLNMISNGKKIAFFSLEMPARSIANRLLAAESKVNLSKIIRANFMDDEFDRVLNAAERLYDKGENMYIVDVPNISLADLRGKARTINKEMKLDCIVIDYIGLISLSVNNRELKDFERVATVSKGLKSLARELHIPIVVLCQVSRDSEEKEPVLSNLRDSGAIEQDADIVCFLHRKRQLTEEEKQKNARDNEGRPTIQVTKLIVAKNRNGETGSFKIGYHAETTTFVNVDQTSIFIDSTPPDKRGS